MGIMLCIISINKTILLNTNMSSCQFHNGLDTVNHLAIYIYQHTAEKKVKLLYQIYSLPKITLSAR